MNKTFITLLLLVAALMTTPCLHADSEAKAIATFLSTEGDLGYIKEENGPVQYIFKLTNTGNAPLVIIDAIPSCGCTAADYPKQPIAVGDTVDVRVIFDPTGFRGAFTKDITVKTNGKKRRTTLQIIGSVIPKN